MCWVLGVHCKQGRPSPSLHGVFTLGGEDNEQENSEIKKWQSVVHMIKEQEGEGWGRMVRKGEYYTVRPQDRRNRLCRDLGKEHFWQRENKQRP